MPGGDGWPVPITNHGEGMNMAKWVGIYQEFAERMMMQGWRIEDVKKMVEQAGETFPKSLLASTHANNSLFPGANSLMEYDLAGRKKRSFPHKNADYPEGTGPGEWEDMSGDEVGRANDFWNWKENPANASFIDKFGTDNAYNAWLAYSRGNSLRTFGDSPVTNTQSQVPGAVATPQVSSNPAGVTEAAPLGSSTAGNGTPASAASGVFDWWVQYPDGSIHTRKEFDQNQWNPWAGNLSDALNHGYKNLGRRLMYATPKGWTLTPNNSGAIYPDSPTMTQISGIRPDPPMGAPHQAGTGALRATLPSQPNTQAITNQISGMGNPLLGGSTDPSVSGFGLTANQPSRPSAPKAPTGMGKPRSRSPKPGKLYSESGSASGFGY